MFFFPTLVSLYTRIQGARGDKRGISVAVGVLVYHGHTVGVALFNAYISSHSLEWRCGRTP